MSAEILRRAAALMRERAEAASPSPWGMFEQHGRDYADEGWSQIGVKNLGHDVALTYPTGFENDYPEPDATHIASWHPAVALAVADWLDDCAAFAEQESVALNMPDLLAAVDEKAVAVARAYLEEQS